MFSTHLPSSRDWLGSFAEKQVFDCWVWLILLFRRCDNFIPKMKETDFVSQNTQGKSTFLEKSGIFLTWHLRQFYRRSTFHLHRARAAFRVVYRHGCTELTWALQGMMRVHSTYLLLGEPWDLPLFTWDSLCLWSGTKIPHLLETTPKHPRGLYFGVLTQDKWLTAIPTLFLIENYSTFYSSTNFVFSKS